MSLSGQYLEELSRRYKKQVEELQQSLTKTVRALDDQNKRHAEQELYLKEYNAQLKEELNDLSLQVHACIILSICVGAFVFILVVVGVLSYRAIRRQVFLPDTTISSLKQNLAQKVLNRRKSFEGLSDQKSTTSKSKIRRPSEEAMLILKDYNGEVPQLKQRQRKISVCYTNSDNGTLNRHISKRNNRKGDKKQRSSLQNQDYASLLASEEFTKAEHNRKAINGDVINISSKANNKRKSIPASWYNRQSSTPQQKLADTSAKSKLPGDSFSENHILDEDDIVNFIPGADLAYNEFMPDGPSGSYTLENAKGHSVNVTSLPKSNPIDKKFRRLSSPAFFKSAFGKSSKSKTTPPHQSTSWEWYRSKKTDSQKSSPKDVLNIKSRNASLSPPPLPATSHINGYSRSSPNGSSSLSEILSISAHKNSNNSSGTGSVEAENHFRILEEAIISSAASAASTVSAASMLSTNGNSNSNSSSSASSNRSSKKHRTFNKLFKKVF